MNYRIIKYTLGWVIGFEGVCMILPLICAAIYGEPYVLMFAACALIGIVVGGSLICKQPKSIFQKK